MSKNLTKKQALELFQDIKKEVPKNDKPALSFAWCTFVDGLQKDGSISEKQAHNWDNPFSK